MVEYSGTSKIVGKDLNLHIANFYAPAAPLALEYVVTEVPQKCNKQEVREIFPTCTDYPPCRIDVCPRSGNIRRGIAKIDFTIIL